ncbi:hypothetical protein G7047_26030 [Diaphorobacter sp. HDW4A]|uniref:hypothetical protein n=1 Tax=Diaphorobacter sp. HDW4A TaxID=2714924 RepID=UPI0014077604|nr:hypothetical protein [Diaphorobacter sp. HDW4A]QIL83011.1 hypothetical protein G7047_26030 [Diaphorobacter sp. HDW4A]
MATFKIPGSLCAADSRQIAFGNAFDRACSEAITNQQLEGLSVDVDVAEQDDDHIALAAIAYGEASTKDVYEELAAIANVVVRMMRARGYSAVRSFLTGDTTYAYGVKSTRYGVYSKASMAGITRSRGMMLALRAAENALSANPTDYSNGAFFWEGRDFADKVKGGKSSQRYGRGFKFSKPEHNIYDMKDNILPKTTVYWKDSHSKDTKRVRGEYEYAYETTAAYGGTIFIRYASQWVSATGGKEWQ